MDKSDEGGKAMGLYYVGISFGVLLIGLGIGLMLFLKFKNRKQAPQIDVIKALGNEAEAAINAQIMRWAEKNEAQFLAASHYKYQGNKIFEVDGLLVTSRALFVVEIKSISGVVAGDSLAKTWTKQLAKHQFKISNPILQNDQHIRHIMAMLQTRKIPIVSLVIFSKRTEQLAIKNRPNHVIVVQEANLMTTLDQIDALLAPKFSSQQVILLHNRLKTFKTNKQVDLDLHKTFTKLRKAT